jgi:predicted RNase H-like nuclease
MHIVALLRRLGIRTNLDLGCGKPVALEGVRSSPVARAWSSVLAMLVAGVDVWRKRWVAVVLSGGCYERAATASKFDDLLKELSDMAAVGIDMPSGLTTGKERREADHAARAFVGPRGSSVFPTYPREVYEAPNYNAAREECRKLTDGSISQQAYALKERLLEVERTVRGGTTFTRCTPR